MSLKANKYFRLFWIAGLVVLIDQATKALVLQTMPLHQTISVIPGFFNLTHIHNPGGAFGFLADGGPMVRKFMFLFVSFLAMGFVFYFYRGTPQTHRFLSVGFALIFGGAAGNMIDRLRFGKVVDFLDFHIKGMHWPAFNAADSAISIGMTIFVFHILFRKMPD